MLRKILVTGASGFIGSRLVQLLSAHRVGDVRAAVHSAGIGTPVGTEVFHGFDITNFHHIRNVVEGIDCIVHLAGRAHVATKSQSRLEYVLVNKVGTLDLAREAARMGVRRFIFVSTIAANGSVTENGQAFSEESPRAPQDDYARSKAAAEEELESLASLVNMDIVIIRPPLVYGPGVKGNFLKLMRVIASGIPLPLGAITENRRTFLALDNLTDLIKICLDHPAASNQVFLAGDCEDIATAELVTRLAAALGRHPRLVRVPPRALELALNATGHGSHASRLLNSLTVDSSKARQTLNWRPRVGVDDGLARAASFFVNPSLNSHPTQELDLDKAPRMR
jgi:UDP-N-acetyl-alpha-D-quinovosamine dehydrogenase